MLIPFKHLFDKYNIQATGILHVGAHLGEERAAYHQLGIRNIVWVEANPVVAAKLVALASPDMVITAAVSDVDNDVVSFHIANNGQSSSLLELEAHKDEHPDVVYTSDIEVTTSRLDTLIDEFHLFNFNFLNLDLQGMELRALKGLGRRLEDFDYIYTEVNKKHLYKDGALVQELDAYLDAFERVETLWTRHGWGDALYVRRGQS